MLRVRLATFSDFAVDWTCRRDAGEGKYFIAEVPERLEVILQSASYHYVVNCIGVLKNAAAEAGDEHARAEMIAVNETFPHAIAAVAEKLGSRLLHISTDAVFAAEAGPSTEEDVPQPSDFYGRTKLHGEPLSPGALTIRCSIMGPDPIKKRGLFEWFCNQPVHACVAGFDDQLWSGVSTLQFADFAAELFSGNLFTRLRAESPVQHFCPNAAVTKYQLLQLLGRFFRPDIAIGRRQGGKVTRILKTHGLLQKVYDSNRPMDVAIGELSTYIEGRKPGLC